MNRDELAEAIYIREVTRPEDNNCGYGINPDGSKCTVEQWCYRCADAFIDEREAKISPDMKPLAAGDRVVYCNPNGSLYLEKGTIHCITGTDLTTMHVDMDCGTRIHTSKDFLARIVSEPPAPEVEPELIMSMYCISCTKGPSCDKCTDPCCGVNRPTGYQPKEQTNENQ